MTKKNLPSSVGDLTPEEIQEMTKMLRIEKVYHNYLEWQTQMSKPIKKGWKENLYIRVKVKGKSRPYRYLPQSTIRFLLRYFFNGLYKVEVINSYHALNSINVTVRLHYFHPFLKEWLFHDGVAAAGMQMNEGCKDVTDFTQMKQSAMEMAFPKAKTVALKNAAKEFGAAFGAFLNDDLPTFTFKENPIAAEGLQSSDPMMPKHDTLSHSKITQKHGTKSK